MLPILPFNNCGVQQNLDPLTPKGVQSSFSEFECEEEENPEECKSLKEKKIWSERLALIELQILSKSPMHFLDTDTYIYIAGRCNIGGFQDHSVVWTIYGGQEFISETPPEEKVYCNNGEFFVRVPIPQFAKSQNLKLEVELLIYDENKDLLLPSSVKTKKYINLVMVHSLPE